MAELQLSQKLIYLTRAEWDDSGAPRLGVAVPIDEHTEAWQHHTVGIDDDATPNQWGGLADCKRRMRFLRTVRPDLGLDVPYTWVGFLMEQAFLGEGGLVVCEGRGPGRRGVHTKYHNRTGVALSLDGNFEDFSIDLDPWIPQLSRFWSWAKYEIPIPNLGTVTPHDADVWGHQQSGANTACPGMFIMSKLAKVTIEKPEEEPELELVMTDGAFVWLTDWRVRHYVKNLDYAQILMDKGKWPAEITESFQTNWPIGAAFLRLPRREDLPA